MMARWGLAGMRSFEQTNVARKEGSRLTASSEPVAESLSVSSAETQSAL